MMTNWLNSTRRMKWKAAAVATLLGLFTLNAWAQSVKKDDPANTASITLKPGERAVIGTFTESDTSCIAMGVPTVSVISPPAHGTVEILSKDDILLVEAGPCTGKKFKGLEADYTAATGCTGRDRFQVQSVFSDGYSEQKTVLVTIAN